MAFRCRLLTLCFAVAQILALKMSHNAEPWALTEAVKVASPPPRFPGTALNTWMGVNSEVKCKTVRVIDGLSTPSFLWFPKGDMYGQYCNATSVGYDLLPQIANGDPNFYRFFFSQRAFALKSDINLAERVHVSDCIQWPQHEQPGRTIQRVGPFSSTGGYDAWLASWENSDSFQSVLDQHPDGVFIKSFAFGVVDSHGSHLGLPPLHIHHQHGGMGTSVGYRSTWSSSGIPQMIIAADYQCMSRYGGVSCLRREFPSGFGMFANDTLNAESYINDVRPIGSEAFNWWIERVIEWIPKAHSRIRPVSQMVLNRRVNLDIAECAAFQLPTDRHSFWWYTVRIPRDMHSILIYGHSHVAMLDRAYLFAATPKQLGLHKLPQSKNDWDPVSLHLAGFDGVEEMMQYVSQHLANETTTNRTICRYNGLEELVGEFFWDRSTLAGTDCSAWNFKEGDIVTSLGFSHPLRSSSTGYATVRDRSRIPGVYGMHQTWFVYYSTDEDRPYHETFTGNGTLSGSN